MAGEVEVKHPFVSPKPSSADSTKLDGPKWNDPLTFAGGNDGEVLAQDSTATVVGATGTIAVGARWVPFISPIPVTSNDQIPNGQARIFDGETPRKLALRYNDDGNFIDIASVTLP
jgi:hypothetical protein